MERFNLTPEQHDRLEDIITELEFDPRHPDDLFNLGGAWAIWETYSEETKQAMIEEAKEA